MTPPDTSTYFMMLLSVTGILVGKGRGERELLRVNFVKKIRAWALVGLPVSRRS
jgi:hypothetical protein